MKTFLLIITMVTLSAAAQAATSGQYVCQDVVGQSGNVGASDIASALNAMECDNAKPISMTHTAETANYFSAATVCCVKK